MGNGEAEPAIRPITIGLANWLQIGGDSGLPTASVVLSTVLVHANATKGKKWVASRLFTAE